MKNKTKYYHCSHIPHKVGSVVHTISEYGVLFMTNNPKPHYTLVDNEGRNNDIKNQKLYCYQVLPLGVVKRGRCWDELTTTIGFEIVRSLGECARNNTFSGVDKNGRTMIFGKKRKKKSNPLRARTHDPRLAKPMLSQLSYAPDKHGGPR